MLKKVLTVVLSIIIIVQTASIGISAIATNIGNDIGGDVELEELRDAYTKHFQTSDGLYYAEVHSNPIHSYEHGEWVDIVNSSTSNGAASTLSNEYYVPSRSSYIKCAAVTSLFKNTTAKNEFSVGTWFRTYVDFIFPELTEGCTFYNAELILHQTSVTNTASAVEYICLYDLTGLNSWSYNTVTWNNQPVSNARNGHTGLPHIDSKRLSSNTSATYSFDLSEIARKYYFDDDYDSTNNGYLLAISDETKPVVVDFGGFNDNSSIVPALRVYYTRGCQGCGEKCVFDNSTGRSCSCTCASWEECDCLECGFYCVCKLDCKYGEGCGCECASEEECNCVACKGWSYSEQTGNIKISVVTDGTKNMTERYTYNEQDAVTNIVDTNENTVSYTYSTNSEQPATISTGSSIVSYNYNENDLPTNVSQVVTGLTNGCRIVNRYSYDEVGKNITAIRHNDFSYNLLYDSNGNNTEIDVGSNLLAAYSYDTYGNLTEIEYGNADCLLYSYDSENRLQQVSVDSSGSTDLLFEFAYNSDGDLETVWDYATGMRTDYFSNGYYVYSGNSLVQEVYFYNEEYDGYDGVSFSGQWGYADTEELGSEFDFVTGETTYAKNIYTAACEMVSNIVYDYFGRKTSSTTESEYSDGNTLSYVTVTENVEYNDTATTAGTLPMIYESIVTNGATTTRYAFRYSYDDKGNITAVFDTTTTPERLVARYAYDEASQLVREDNALLNKTLIYAYDKGGNLSTKTEYSYTLSVPDTVKNTVDYSYDDTWKDLLIEYNGVELHPDGIGNPQQYINGHECVWIGKELVYFNKSGRDDFVECRYNENGLRSFKRSHKENNPESLYYYFWSNDSRLLGCVIDEGNTNENSVQMSVLYDADDEPIGFTVDERTYYYLKNVQKDVLCVTDEVGTPLVEYVYDAWGKLESFRASQTVSSQDYEDITKYNPFTYRSYLYDPELKFYYLQSRYYDPETGRFLNADSILDTGKSIVGTNVFAYCDNAAVDHEDKGGRFGENIRIVNLLGLGFSNTGDWFKSPWTTTIKCLQAYLGYCDLYDKAAPVMGCLIDCLISEFNFRSQKWRVELWKGRYGINRGAEIGFYRRDEKIKLFKGFYACLKKEEGLMQMNFALYESDTNKKCNLLFERSTDDEGHWWLTGFLFDGWLSLAKGKPDNLVLDANITFYDSNMASLFDRNLGSRVKDGEFKTRRTNEKVNVVWASYDGVYCFYDAENQIIRKVNINNA